MHCLKPTISIFTLGPGFGLLPTVVQKKQLYRFSFPEPVRMVLNQSHMKILMIAKRIYDIKATNSLEIFRIYKRSDACLFCRKLPGIQHYRIAFFSLHQIKYCKNRQPPEKVLQLQDYWRSCQDDTCTHVKPLPPSM